MTRRQALLIFGAIGGVVVGVPAGWTAYTSWKFPSDKTPQGAYLRITIAMSEDRLRDCFPYLETAAQHALFTIHDYRKRSLELIRKFFEPPERERWEEACRAEGDAFAPPDVWVIMALQRGWDARLRRDLSGIRTVEQVKDRATVETVRGTRYPFRRADNGIWGLTLYTAQLVAHKERAARDFQMVERAAKDYERARPSDKQP